MTIADDYFNTPPENREPIMSAEDWIEREERHAEFLSELTEETIWNTYN